MCRSRSSCLRPTGPSWGFIWMLTGLRQRGRSGKDSESGEKAVRNRECVIAAIPCICAAFSLYREQCSPSSRCPQNLLFRSILQSKIRTWDIIHLACLKRQSPCVAYGHKPIPPLSSSCPRPWKGRLLPSRTWSIEDTPTSSTASVVSSDVLGTWPLPASFSAAFMHRPGQTTTPK